MEALLDSVIQLLYALWILIGALADLLVPWIPLAAWIGYWLFAVDWVRLREIMLRGGAVGVVLIGLMAALVWGMVAPPAGGYHFLLGLQLSNFVGKIVYVTGLLTIMFLCGSVQLAGCCAGWTPVQERVEEGKPEEPLH